MGVYIQVTTACQMSCGHCCVDYGNGKRGKHMPWDTFLGAIHLSQDYDENASLGGGEVTLHPKFRQMVQYVLDNTNMNLFMVTNGGKADKNGSSKNLRWLIELIESGMYADDRINVEMSLDQFHDTVEDNYIYQWFTRERNRGGYYGRTYKRIRDVGDRRLVRAGRALNLPLNDYEWQDKAPESQCVCPDMQVYPDGRITACGCPDAPEIGNIVYHGYNIHTDLGDIDACPNDEDYGYEMCYSPSKTIIKRAIRKKEADAVECALREKAEEDARSTPA